MNRARSSLARGGTDAWVASAALGCRGSVAYRYEAANGYGLRYQTETWMATPMLRVGVGLLKGR